MYTAQHSFWLHVQGLPPAPQVQLVLRAAPARSVQYVHVCTRSSACNFAYLPASFVSLAQHQAASSNGNCMFYHPFSLIFSIHSTEYCFNKEYCLPVLTNNVVGCRTLSSSVILPGMLKEAAIRDILGTQVADIGFALRVKIFLYPEHVCSVWLMLALKYCTPRSARASH